MDFSEAEIHRYSRHILLGEVGGTGQARLRAASVLLIGAGGLGSPLALYLAAAGIGRIGIVDDDVVELSNLQRQIAHGMADLGTAKATSAAAAAHAINPDVAVEPHRTRLTAANALELIAGYDIVCDGSDNFPTRFLVADACVLIPTVHPDRVTPHTEGFAAVVWHLLVSHPALAKSRTKWESVK